MLLPGCAAVMVQVPAPIKAAVEPATVQTATVDEVNVTGKPELAEATRLREVLAV